MDILLITSIIIIITIIIVIVILIIIVNVVMSNVEFFFILLLFFRNVLNLDVVPFTCVGPKCFFLAGNKECTYVARIPNSNEKD